MQSKTNNKFFNPFIMKNTTNNTIGQTIVGFKTARGGRFFNAGHVSFLGECKISDFTNDLFLQFENQHDIYNAVKGRENLEAKYYECDENNDFSFFAQLGFKVGEKQYFRNGEYAVGLTEAEALGIEVYGEENED